MTREYPFYVVGRNLTKTRPEKTTDVTRKTPSGNGVGTWVNKILHLTKGELRCSGDRWEDRERWGRTCRILTEKKKKTEVRY